MKDELRFNELTREIRRHREVLAEAEGSLKHYHQHIAQHETTVSVLRGEADDYSRQLHAAHGAARVSAVCKHQRERTVQISRSIQALRQRQDAAADQHHIKLQNHHQRRKFLFESKAAVRDEQRVVDVSMQNVLEKMDDIAQRDLNRQQVFAARCDLRAQEHAAMRLADSEANKRRGYEKEKMLLEETVALQRYYEDRIDALGRIENEADLSLNQGDAEISKIQDEFDSCREILLHCARAGDRAEEYQAKINALETANKLTDEELQDTQNRLELLDAEHDVRRGVEMSKEKEVNDRIDNLTRSITTLKRKLTEVRRADAESRSLVAAKVAGPLDEDVRMTELEAQRLESEHKTSQRALQASLQEAAAVATLATDRVNEEAGRGHRLEAELNRLKTEVGELQQLDELHRHETSRMAENLIRQLS